MKVNINEDVDKAAEELAATLELKAVPLKNNKLKVAKFLVALEATSNVTKSLKYAKIPHRTAYDWRKRYPPFKRLWEQAVQARVDRAYEVVAIVQELYPESPVAALRAALAILKSHDPERWGDKVKVTSQKTFKVQW